MDEYSRSYDVEQIKDLMMSNPNAFEDMSYQKLQEYQQTRESKRKGKKKYEEEFGFDSYDY